MYLVFPRLVAGFAAIKLVRRLQEADVELVVRQAMAAACGLSSESQIVEMLPD